MALHIIIDGYNLIRRSARLSFLDARDMEAGREALLESLAAYRRRRPQHLLTVIFDGWQGGGLRETRDVFQGVKVIFSRRGERADEVIKRLLAKEGQRALVVSSDRELREWADRVGAAWIEADHFEMAHLSGTEAAPEDEPQHSIPGTKKKGPARRKSKRERQRQHRLKKL